MNRIAALLALLLAATPAAARNDELLESAERHAAAGSPHADEAQDQILSAYARMSLLDTEQAGKAGDADQEALADALWSLGNGYSMLGAHVLAAQAFQEAANRSRRKPWYRYDYAIELAAGGYASPARQAFDEASAAAPEHVEGVAQAAFYALVEGDAPRSIALHERVLELDLDEDRRAYPLIVRLLATRMAGLPMREAAKAVDHAGALDAWPGPVAQYLLGRERLKHVEIAATADRSMRQQQLCEALFYVGFRFELDGKRELAIRHYRAAIATQVVAYREHLAAQIRLQRLGQVER